MDRKNDRPAGAGVVSAYARIRKIRREDDFFHINRPAPRFFLFDDFPFIREFRLLSCYNGNRIIMRWAFAGR